MSKPWTPPEKLSDLAFVDVETTGLDDKIHRVIEIAVTRVRPDPATWDTPLGRATYRFTPSSDDMEQAQPDAFKTNGFRLDHPDWVEALPMISPAANDAWNHVARLTRKASIVAQNVPFDRGFMWEELKRRGLLYNHEEWGLLPPWERRFLDTQSYAFLVVQEAGITLWGLHHAYAALKLPALTEHRAEADVKRAMAVMRHVHTRYNRSENVAQSPLLLHEGADNLG